MKRLFLATSVAFAAMTASTQAADLYTPVEPASTVYDWSGFYVGGNLGYGEADFDGLADGDQIPVTGSQLNGVDGLVGGGHIGYNVQVEQLVLGVEGDFMFMDWSASADDGIDTFVDVSVDMLASIRGRMGLAFDRLFVYGTAGLAFVDATWSLESSGPFSGAGSVDFDNVGVVVGGGAEFAITDMIIVGGEVLHFGFDQFKDTSGLTGDSASGDFAALDDIWVARGRVTIRFGGL